MVKTSFSLWIILLFQAVQTTEPHNGVTINDVQIKSDHEYTENVEEGSTIILTCSANIIIPRGQPSQISSLFYKGENKGILLENVTSYKTESQYTIKSAQASHSGYYHCVVAAGSKTKKSQTTFITVKGKLQRPVLTIHPMEVTVGNSTELRCETSGEFPPFTFIFYKYKNGRHFRLSDIKDVNKYFATYQLKVAEITEKRYSCKIQGITQGTSSNYSEIVDITVRALPVSMPILHLELDDRVKEGLTLKCIVSKGSFPITYTFSNGSIIHKTTSHSTEAKFFINSANRHHNGSYYCTASNAATPEAEKSNQIAIIVNGCSQLAVPVAWTLVTTLFLSVSNICSN